jgi:hypothetical protein
MEDENMHVKSGWNKIHDNFAEISGGTNDEDFTCRDLNFVFLNLI